MSASSSSSPSQSGRASRVENDQNICAVCADVFLWCERSTTLSCGHIFHPSCVEDLARHLRRRLFGGVIAINCPLCRRPISMSSISSFEHNRLVPAPRLSFPEFARRHLTQHRWQRSAIVAALVEDIARRGLPRFITPPGWRPFVREYRRRVLMDPVLPGVPTLLVNTVFHTCSPHKEQRSWSEILHWRVCCRYGP